MSKVIAYIRVSTNKQDLENQRHEIGRYCTARGLVVDEWDEDIASGTVRIQDRQAGQVFASLQSGDRLVVSEVSRISRSVGTLVTVLEDCIHRGVMVTSVKEDITFKDDITSTVMMVGLGLAAQLERKLISARTKEALARKRAEGVRLGRPPGSSGVDRLKLYGKDDEILQYMRKGVSKRAIARLLDVGRSTLHRYIQLQELDDRLLLERIKQTTVNQKPATTDSTSKIK